MTFQKATKQKSKLRCAIYGPSGSGKTFSALRIAKGMGGKTALIDTEGLTASKYADRFDFDTCDLRVPTVPHYIELINTAKCDVLIIDSMSHGWQELIEQMEQLAKTKYNGNFWGAWRDGTPIQKELVRAIQNAPFHIIATMRSKTEWMTQQDDRGKIRPVRVGLTPEQGKGIEYEFDLLMEISTEHLATVIKDRTGKFQDMIIDKPGEDFGQKLSAWLNDGVVMQPPAQDPLPSQTSTPPPVATQASPPQAAAPAQATPPTQRAAMNTNERQVMNALVDYYKAQQTPGWKIDKNKMCDVIWSKLGRWPANQQDAATVKQYVMALDIMIQIPGHAA